MVTLEICPGGSTVVPSGLWDGGPRGGWPGVGWKLMGAGGGPWVDQVSLTGWGMG